jgi:cobalt-zinc-cadmium efflux system membrane fusion protein
MKHSIQSSLPRLCGVLLTAAALTACHEGDKKASANDDASKPKIEGDRVVLPPNAPQQASLEVEAAKPLGDAVIRVTGRLTWNDDTTVRIYPSVAGRVEKIEAQIGQNVSVNDRLAMLWSADFGQAQADASRAATDLRLAERTLNRTRDLLQHGAAAVKDVEAAENDHESKEAEVERTQAQLRRYGVEQGSIDGLFPLKTPLAGVLVEKTINPGQEVRPDQMLAGDAKIVRPLFVVSDPHKLWVQLDVAETDINTVRAGQKLEVHSRAYPDKVFRGKIEVIGSSLDPQTRAVQVRGFVDNEDGLLKAEMYVNVDITIDAMHLQSPALTPASLKKVDIKKGLAAAQAEIPVNAVFSKDEQRFVFIEKSAGEYQRQQVELGLESHGRVAVVTGVTVGQRVVTEGSLLLQAMTEGGNE